MKNLSEVFISKATANNFKTFSELVFKYISRDYLDIDSTFANNIIDTHKKEVDIYGYFTLKKEIWVLKKTDAVLGFIVTTIKRGGSVKIGPQIMLPEYQGKGYGSKFRDLIEQTLCEEKYRKAYVTLASKNHTLLRWDLKRGYRIEAQLSSHFNDKHDEIVLGKFLCDRRVSKNENLNTEFKPIGPEIITDKTYKVSMLNGGSSEKFKAMILEFMPKYYDQIDETFADNIIKSTDRINELYKKKGKIVVVLENNNEMLASIVLTPKRGGACKLCPLLIRTGYERHIGITELVKYAEELVAEIKCRKIYTIIPVFEHNVLKVFYERQYETEGLLREPYKPGIDTVVLGKLL